MKVPDLSEYCNICGGDGCDLNRPLDEKDDDGQPMFERCGFCNGTGQRPTDFGVKMIEFLKLHLPRMWEELKDLK